MTLADPVFAYVHVADVVEAIVRAMEAERERGLRFTPLRTAMEESLRAEMA